jgi:hypothetical protein
MRQMVGRTLPDLSFRIEPQIFADLRAALVLVKHHHAAGAYIRIDQLEMQIGQKLKRLAPVHPKPVLAAQRAVGLRLTTVRGHLRVLGILLPIAEEIQQRGIEQDWILQEGKMAGIGQDQQAGAGNCCGDILRVLALDAFVVVSVHHQDRRADGAELRIRPIRLVLPHLADLFLKGIVLIGRR